MVEPDVEYDRNTRIKAEEGILVFTGLENEIVIAADAVGCADGGQRRADEHGRVGAFFREKNLRCHP